MYIHPPALGGGDGADSACIVTYTDEFASLGGSQSYLRGDRLPFISPPTDSQAHPVRLLERLGSLAGYGGVLLVGAAGTGKTRTCLEVSALATRQAWDVYFIKAGGTPVPSDDIAGLTMAGSDKILLVVDYLNESGLDLTELRSRVLPDAVRRGKSIALLGSVRPAVARTVAVDGLFEIANIHPDEQQCDLIVDQICSSLAPTAAERLGRGRMKTLCGIRPAIAVLVASEAERRACLGQLGPEHAASIRPGELMYWLRRRLAEHRLIPEQATADVLDFPDPSLAQQACAAIVAATPQHENELLACAAAILGDSDHAEHVLRSLVSIGWLIDAPGGLTTVHDAVCDELLEKTLINQVSGAVHAPVVHAVIGNSLSSVRSLTRYATNFGRLLRDLELEGRAESLTRHCREWLRDKVDSVVAILTAAPALQSEHALAAMIANPAWAFHADGALESVLERWLPAAQGDHSPFYATQVLFSSLRATPEPPAVVIEAALQWSEHNVSRALTGVVMGEVLRQGLDVETRRRAVTCADRWLSANASRRAANVSIVLQPLLHGENVSAAKKRRTVRSALHWVSKFGIDYYTDASFVYRWLLRFDGLSKNNALEAKRLAIEWLEVRGRTLEANYVIVSLLRRSDLTDRQEEVCADHALLWLDTHGSTGDMASYIVRWLLQRTLRPDAAQQAIRSACAWLASAPLNHDTHFTLRALLRRRDLPEDLRAPICAYSLAWLEHHKCQTGVDASWVITPLVRIAPTENIDAASRHALDWLNSRGSTMQACHLAAALIGRHDIPNSARSPAVRHGLDWLELHGKSADAWRVLSALMKCRDLTGGEPSRVITAALNWLDAGNDGPDARPVLRAALRRKNVAESDAQRIAGHALRWLGTYHSIDSDRVLDPLLSRTDLTADQSAAVARVAVKWIREHGGQAAAGWVLANLVRYRGLPQGQFDDVVTAATNWLALYHQIYDARTVLAALLEHSEPPDAIQGYSLTWLAHWSTCQDADGVLTPLVRSLNTPEGVTASSRTQILRHATVWLESLTDSDRPAPILDAILGIDDLSDKDHAYFVGYAEAWLGRCYSRTGAYQLRQRLIARAGGIAIDANCDAQWHLLDATLDWMDTNVASPECRHLLGVLLRRYEGLETDQRGRVIELCRQTSAPEPTARLNGALYSSVLDIQDLPEPELEHFADLAVTWLADHENALTATSVIRRILYRRTDFPAERIPTVIGAAARWLTRHSLADRDMQHVLFLLLRRRDIDAQETGAANAAINWLDKFASTEPAQLVLNALLYRPDSTESQHGAAVEHAFGWLKGHATEPRARHILAPLLTEASLSERRVQMVLQWSEGWLAANPEDPGAGAVLRRAIMVKSLTTERRASLVDAALDWAARFPALDRTGKVYATVLQRPGLSDDQSARARRGATEWLRTDGAQVVVGWVTRAMLARPDLDEDQRRIAQHM